MNYNRQWKIAIAALALVPAAILATGCGGDNSSGRPVGIVYTENNVAAPNGNAVLAFRRDASGNLTSIGTFPTSGAGLGNSLLTPNGTLDTDREIIINPQRTRLYAVNQGSDTIAVFPIHSDGTLGTQTTYSSGGHAPVSLALVGNVLTVLNSSMGPDDTVSTIPPNYSTFTINPANGGLSAAAVSTIALPVGQTPSVALPSPDGTLIFGADFRPQQTNPGVLRSFQLSSNGTLTQSPGSPLPLDASIFTGASAGAPPFVLGSAINPDPSKPYLYVSSPLAKKIAVYRYATNGMLTFVASVANSGAAACWLRVSPNGEFLYSSNAASGDVSEFTISSDGATVTQAQAVNVSSDLLSPATINGNPWQIDVDPSGQFLFVLTPRDFNLPAGTTLGPGNTLHSFTINQTNGNLTQAPTSPVTLGPAGGQPQGLLAI
ncbi:MAG TPA: beta-propeller fold lactonase family protein [Armatimonadota bacterium]|nr:beta-propeller fold lactonase family protein [Armatimonadota bacterium]